MAGETQNSSREMAHAYLTGAAIKQAFLSYQSEIADTKYERRETINMQNKPNYRKAK